jgi:hypothetical protein
VEALQQVARTLNPIPQFPCHDCRVNTIPLDGDREYYEIQDELWQSAWPNSGVGQEDNGPGGKFLCIGCLESRLGRMLVKGDFKEMPANNPSPWYSDRLNSRLVIHDRNKAKWPQWHPKALVDAIHSVDGYLTFLDYGGGLTTPRFEKLPGVIMEIPNAQFVDNGRHYKNEGFPWQEKSDSAEKA